MNTQQKILLWLGAAAFSLLNLCPPWVGTWIRSGHVVQEIFLGFHPIWNDPGTDVNYARLDFYRLVPLEVTLLAMIAVGLFTMRGQANWHIGSVVSCVAHHRRATAIVMLSVVLGATAVLVTSVWLKSNRASATESASPGRLEVGVSNVFEIVEPSTVPTADELLSAQVGRTVKLAEPSRMPRIAVKPVGLLTGVPIGSE